MSGEIHGPPDHPSPTLVPQRNCDGCAVCCKLFEVPQVEKEAGEWCRHCGDHLRCAIHPARPQVCRDFYCFYRREPAIPEHWRPSLSHMVIVMDMSGMRTIVHVDPDYRDIWRSEPYYGNLKTWAHNHIRTAQQLFVSVDNAYTAILPDRDEDLGPVKGKVIRSSYIHTPNGPTYRLEVCEPDDPRVQPGYIEPPAA